jgi:diguanylate cyclase (GGDEF)-like protein/PAS domain S-box-containing protein
VLGILLALVLARTAEISLVLSWFVPFFIIFCIRLLLPYRYKQLNASQSAISFVAAKKWLNVYRLSAFFGGLAWGMVAWLLYQAQFAATDNLITYTLGGLSIAILAVMALDFASVALYLLGVWAPILMKMLLLKAPFFITLVLMLFLFLVFVLLLTRGITKNLTENIGLKLEAFESEKSLQKLLKQSRLQFEKSPLASIQWDMDFNVVQWNAAAEVLFGYKSEVVIGKKGFFLAAEDERKKVKKMWAELVNIGKHLSPTQFMSSSLMVNQLGNTATIRNWTQDDHELVCEWHNAILLDSEGKVIGVTSQVQDITQKEHAKLDLEQQRKFATNILGASVSPLFVISPTHEVIVWNDACAALTGTLAEEVLGTIQQWRGFYETARPCLADLVIDSHIDSSDFYQYPVKPSKLIPNGIVAEGWFNKDGRRVYLLIEAAPVFDSDGQLMAVVESLQDITRFKLAESEIFDLAYYDPLTNLPNRRMLVEKIQKLQNVTDVNPQYIAFIFIDLDNFKLVNDTMGHNAGDQLLMYCAQRLLSCVRSEDTVVRLGGDEFVLIIADLSVQLDKAQAQAAQIAQKVLLSLEKPYSIAGQQHLTTASLGIFVTKGQDVREDEIMKYADTALYQAKDFGKNTYRFYDAELHENTQKRMSLIGDLIEAVQNKELVLYYQPQVESAGNDVQLTGAEALIRWKHPKLGMIPPVEFIPLAETTDVINTIGEWVLIEACNQLNTWSKTPATAALTLAVNVSAKQFRNKNFVDNLLSVIELSKVNPNLLKIEITESIMMRDIQEAIDKIDLLKAYGIRFSMDDFGTGYSSLSYLRQLPLDQIKIDKSFVDQLNDPKGSIDIVQTIISMAENLNLDIIAEGVETREQQAMLARLGCDKYQGYLFGKPMVIAEFDVLAAEMQEAFALHKNDNQNQIKNELK